MDNSKQNKSINQKDNETAPTHYVLWMVVIAMLIVITGLGVISLELQKKEAEIKTASLSKLQQLTPMPTQPPQMGSINLSSTSSQIQVGKNGSVTVKADSEGKGVVGFDILITYDPTKLKINKVTPLNSDFQVSSFTKKVGQISITGTKTSSGQVSQVLTNASLVSVSVTSLQTGMTVVDIKPSINNERTRLVDKNYQQYTPKSSSLQIEIL